MFLLKKLNLIEHFRKNKTNIEIIKTNLKTFK